MTLSSVIEPSLDLVGKQGGDQGKVGTKGGDRTKPSGMVGLGLRSCFEFTGFGSQHSHRSLGVETFAHELQYCMSFVTVVTH